MQKTSVLKLLFLRKDILYECVLRGYGHDVQVCECLCMHVCVQACVRACIRVYVWLGQGHVGVNVCAEACLTSPH